MKESGHYSIAGFFFQFLASADDALSLYDCKDSNEGPSPVFLIEQLGQDAEIRYPDNGRRRLIQYKYSSIGAPIEPSDLREILLAFKRSLDVANLKPDEVDLYLTTNRARDQAADKWWDAKDEAQFKKHLHAKVSDAEKSKLRYTVLWPIFQRLSYDPRTEDGAIESIEKLGKEYGMLECEIRDGATKLIACVMDIARSKNREVTRERLLKSFVGFSNPYKLLDGESRKRQTQMVELFQRGESQPAEITPRSFSSRIVIAASSQPLVVVTGEGGTGKSVAICSAAQHSLLSPTEPPSFALVLKAHELDNVSIQRTVATWRNQANNPDGNSVDDSLKRLQVASTLKPTITIYIDGVDENGGIRGLKPEARDALKRLINLAIESFRIDQQTLGVILTCRTKRDLRGLGGGGFDPPITEPIVINDFDNEDILRSAEKLPNGREIAKRLFAHFNVRQGFRGTSRPSTLVAVDQKRANLLQRPIIWRFFSELDHESQHAFLDGQDEALERLASKYSDWFLNKVADRRGDEVRNDAEAAFRVVAQRFVARMNRNPATRHEDWTALVRSIGCADPSNDQLFAEGVSAGILEYTDRDCENWQWKYDWLCANFAKRKSVRD